MQRHWTRHGPPTYRSVALYLGLGEAQTPASETLTDPEDLANFLRAFPGAAQA
jgi:hypothetical protein